MTYILHDFKNTQKMSLTAHSIVKRKAALMSTRIDRDIFVLNPIRDSYIGLDEIGRRVWDLIDIAVTIDHLCHQLTQEYQGNQQQISVDLMAFLDELNMEGLLDVQ